MVIQEVPAATWLGWERQQGGPCGAGCAGVRAQLTSRMVQRSDWHSTSSQGWNMPRVTQFRRMTSMLTCSNQVRGGR